MFFSSSGSQLLAVGKVFEDKMTPETKAYGRITLNVCQLYQSARHMFIYLSLSLSLAHPSPTLSWGACKAFKINVLWRCLRALQDMSKTSRGHAAVNIIARSKSPLIPTHYMSLFNTVRSSWKLTVSAHKAYLIQKLKIFLAKLQVVLPR